MYSMFIFMFYIQSFILLFPDSSETLPLWSAAVDGVSRVTSAPHVSLCNLIQEN